MYLLGVPSLPLATVNTRIAPLNFEELYSGCFNKTICEKVKSHCKKFEN